MQVTLLIADDHPLILDGLIKQLECNANFKIIGQASDGIKAWDLYLAHRPDITILDIDMEGMSGIEVAKKIKAESPSAKVLLLTMHNEPWVIYRAKMANPDSILFKNTPISSIISAINEVIKGERVFSKEVQDCISQGAVMDQALLSLTSRETEILQLIAQGLATKAIAEKLFISVNTVETYRKNLFQKFEVCNMAQLVKKAVELGIVQ